MVKFQPIILNLTSDFWKEILANENTLRTTYVRNATNIFKPLSYYLSKNMMSLQLQQLLLYLLQQVTGLHHLHHLQTLWSLFHGFLQILLLG